MYRSICLFQTYFLLSTETKGIDEILMLTDVSQLTITVFEYLKAFPLLVFKRTIAVSYDGIDLAHQFFCVLALVSEIRVRTHFLDKAEQSLLSYASIMHYEIIRGNQFPNNVLILRRHLANFV